MDYINLYSLKLYVIDYSAQILTICANIPTGPLWTSEG